MQRRIESLPSDCVPAGIGGLGGTSPFISAGDPSPLVNSCPCGILDSPLVAYIPLFVAAAAAFALARLFFSSSGF